VVVKVTLAGVRPMACVKKVAELMEMKFAVTDAIAYTPKDGVRQARDAKKGV